jgi:catechol 2,3-dioxygenase-like lactoylglutathione lyase family enzyme
MARHFLDHIQLSVEDYPRAKAFYAKALEPLGFSLMMEFPEDGPPSYGGFAAEGKPFLWISGGGRQTPPTHIAFGAPSHAVVEAFYAAALAAGGTDHGAPGIRAHYHPTYYAAFVRDPEGHNIEAVCHGEETARAEKRPARKRAAAPKKQRRRATAAKKTPRAARRAPARKRPARRTTATTARRKPRR